MTEPKYCYSPDNETFHTTDFGEFIDSLRSDSDNDESLVGCTYWQGDAEPLKHSDNINVERLLESFDDYAYEEVGEIFDNDYSRVPAEAKKELEQLLLAWAEKHVAMNYWRVKNVVELKITREDLE